METLVVVDNVQLCIEFAPSDVSKVEPALAGESKVAGTRRGERALML